MKPFFAQIRYMFLNMIRSPIKTFLVAGFALLAVFSVNYLQHIIERNEAEIDRLYDEFVVTGYVASANPRSTAFDMNNFINPRIPNWLQESEFVSGLYLESGKMGVRLLPYGEATFDRLVEIREEIEDWVLAFYCLDAFVESNIPQELDGAVGVALASDYIGDFSLSLMDGFSSEDFVHPEGQRVIPIIVHESFMARYGFNYGDEAHLAMAVPLAARNVRIVGSFAGGRIVSVARFHRPMILMPADGLRFLLRHIQYNTVNFEINSAFNRDLATFRDDLWWQLAAPGAGRDDLILHLNDDDLRLVVGPLEQNLLLLRLLYPVALTVVVILAAALAVLIVLQSAKIAAIMRSLGIKKRHVRLALCGEYLVVSIMGLALSLVLMPLIGIGLELAILVHVGLYLVGAVIGSVTGSVLNTNRPPLDLLQVRE